MAKPHASADTINTPLIALIGIVTAILTFAVIIGVQVLYYHAAASEDERKVIQVRDVDADNELAAQEGKLANYGWTTPDKKKVVIPIEEAMQVVVRQWQEKPGPGTPAAPRESPAPQTPTPAEKK